MHHTIFMFMSFYMSMWLFHHLFVRHLVFDCAKNLYKGEPKAYWRLFLFSSMNPFLLKFACASYIAADQIKILRPLKSFNWLTSCRNNILIWNLSYFASSWLVVVVAPTTLSLHIIQNTSSKNKNQCPPNQSSAYPCIL